MTPRSTTELKPPAGNGSRALLRRGRASRLFDQFAITLSGLCLVHCVVSALLLAMLASSGSALMSPVIHEAGLVFAIILGAASLGPGLLRENDRLPGAIGLVGVAIMATGLAFHSTDLEILCTIVGVALVALAHGLSYQPHAA